MHLNNGGLILFKKFSLSLASMMQFFLCPSYPAASFLTLDLVTLQYLNCIFTTAEPLAFCFSCICSSLWCWMGFFFFLTSYTITPSLIFTQIFIFVYVHPKSLIGIYCLRISHIFIKSDTKSYEFFFQSLHPVILFFPSSLAPASFRHLVLLI